MKLKRGVYLFLIVVLLVVLPHSKAELVVTPFEANLNDSFGSLNSNIFSVMNTGVDKVDIQAEIDEYSDYLRGFVIIKPEVFSLEPGATQNLVVESKFSNTLSPEKHDVIINLLNTKKKEIETSFDLFFSINGEQIRNLVLNDARIIQKPDGTIHLEVLAENKGNVIARGLPKITIRNANREIESTINGQFRVLPSEIKKISFPVETSLEKGTYSLSAQLEYGSKITNKFDSEFDYEPIEYFKTNSKKQIKQGEKLMISIALSNNESFDSQYKIEAAINGTDIKSSANGALYSEEQKNVTLTVDTSQLFSGRYVVKLKIQTGKSLEKSFLKEIELKVNPDLSPVYFLAGIIGFILIVSFVVTRFTKRSHEMVHVHHHLGSLDVRLNKSKADLDELILKTEKFIDESNEWIIRKHGEQYAFK